MKESIRVDSIIKNRVAEHVEETKQSIGGFYDLAAEEILFQKWKSKQLPSYRFEIGQMACTDDSIAVYLDKHFSDMTEDEKKIAFLLNARPQNKILNL